MSFRVVRVISENPFGKESLWLTLESLSSNSVKHPSLSFHYFKRSDLAQVASLFTRDDEERRCGFWAGHDLDLVGLR